MDSAPTCGVLSRTRSCWRPRAVAGAAPRGARPGTLGLGERSCAESPEQLQGLKGLQGCGEKDPTWAGDPLQHVHLLLLLTVLRYGRILLTTERAGGSITCSKSSFTSQGSCWRSAPPLTPSCANGEQPGSTREAQARAAGRHLRALCAGGGQRGPRQWGKVGTSGIRDTHARALHHPKAAPAGTQVPSPAGACLWGRTWVTWSNKDRSKRDGEELL